MASKSEVYHNDGKNQSDEREWPPSPILAAY